MPAKPISQHNTEISLNAASWDKKPLLQKIYTRFYQEIATALGSTDGKGILEIGSGIGAIKTVLPKCITSDIFSNPWLDRRENAYNINFPDSSLNGVVLFDVWHHLEYPGSVLQELARIVRPGGRVVLFEPAMGLLGKLVYGIFHHEPLGLGDTISWNAPSSPPPLRYYAAQGNCWRMFKKKELPLEKLSPFSICQIQSFSALSYVASGGFSKPQLYPTQLYTSLARIEKILDRIPILFATRIMVVLEKEHRHS